ncbi:MarR family winged helix-turn-helix transcriptional regulator [Agromyces silvae]|uniref:MarR family winged helix-turn-helix transcriptional regulator n=1 Tax=Agromyces silvae TaxID=3388266 RepID=UPI00280ACC47|nr:MarR family transcriptional regulator [Agromyces protaetiae]
MSRTTKGDAARAEVLEALADAGRRQSTAMILFHANLAKRVGLGPSEEKVLELVRRLGHPTVSELAEETGLAKNSISDLLDRLETKGFVTREAHPTDGRKVAIVATEEGVARIGDLFTGMMTRLGELQADYSTEQLAVIAEYQQRAADIQAAEARTLADGAG